MLIIIFLITTLLSLFLCPHIFNLLTWLNVYDIPKQRSMHRCKILRMGGIIFVLAYVFSILLLPISYLYEANENWFMLLGIILGAQLMATLGALDDFFDLSAKTKFLFQWIIAFIVCCYGVSINEFKLFGYGIDLGIFSIPFTMFWIVGITNAVNLLDGLDGLAAGISLIAFIFLIFLTNQSLALSFLLSGLIGGLVTFLRYNAYPAKIFMGDVGSLFLGYNLAVFSAVLLPWHSHFAGFALPIILLGLPIFDTLYTIIRRILSGKPPFMPDKNHIHHKLVRAGYSQKQATAYLYFIAVINGFIVSLLLGISSTTFIYILICMLCLFLIFSLPLTQKQRVKQIHFLRSYYSARLRNL